MHEQVIVRGPGEGRILLVGGGDLVTYKVRSAETEFTFQRGDDLETITGSAGTSVAIAPNVPHTFRNATDRPARLLFVHQPAALEEFFEDFGAPVPHPGELPADVAPPDFGAMAAALERNGVHVVEPKPVG